MATSIHLDEGALLKAYGLDSLEPKVWTDVGHEANGAGGVGAGGGDGNATVDAATLSELLVDEPDPLGLRGTIHMAREVDKTVVPQVHPSSKLFDPKIFLSTIHPDATFADLNAGNAFLRQSVEQRSEALKILVESNFDKFVAVKATTDGVYREMKDATEGPLRDGNEHGVRDLKENLANASAKADQVFMPVLENNLKAVKLRSTLGVFERSRFFFNLPGNLSEALEAGRYEQALRDYKRGKYLMESRPCQLLNYASGQAAAAAVDGGALLEGTNSAHQQAQEQRVFAKVWEAVEKTIQEMRDKLFALLKEPKRGVEEQEKTIEILLELDPKQDPVAVFLESQYNHIRDLMRKSHSSSIAKIEAAASVDALVTLSERDRAKDLQACVGQLVSPDTSYERRIGAPSWQATLELVRQLSETLVQTLPSFWRVCKNLSEGKIKSGSHGIQAQGKRWASESLHIYTSSLAEYFTLTDVSILARKPLSPLPSWVPRHSCASTGGHFMKIIATELQDAVNDLKALNIPNTASILDNLVNNAKFAFIEALCQLWQEDAKIFHRLEDWTMNPEEEATTLFLGELAAFQTHNARIACSIARGSNEGERQGEVQANSRRGEAPPGPEFTARVKATFLDAIYVSLDGLVTLAFSEYNPLDANLSTSQKTIGDKSRQAAVIDVKDLDTRVLLGVTNLGRFSRTVVPRLASQFHDLYRVHLDDDLNTIEEVAAELDKILFNNFIERKGTLVADIFQSGILRGGIDWRRIPEPSGVHPFIYEALLALVQIHAQVRTVAKPLVPRTISTLLEHIASVVLEAFGQIERFGMGGMLQATLEIEFVHQTLAAHVTPPAERLLKQIYETISKKYIRAPGPEGDCELASLQSELENVKRILVATRRATALEFLCFRKPRERQGTGGSSSSGSTGAAGASAPLVTSNAAAASAVASDSATNAVMAHASRRR